MKNRIWILLSISSAAAFGQKQPFAEALKTADSIQITSHKDLYVKDSIPGKHTAYYKDIVVNGKPNKAILKEIVTLDKTSVAELVTMLTHPGEDKDFDMMCFEPHHSILIYKEGNCRFIDVCFQCMGFTGSKTLDFSNGLLRSEKDWNNLEAFFRKKGIQYEMPEKRE